MFALLHSDYRVLFFKIKLKDKRILPYHLRNYNYSSDNEWLWK